MHGRQIFRSPLSEVQLAARRAAPEAPAPQAHAEGVRRRLPSAALVHPTAFAPQARPAWLASRSAGAPRSIKRSLRQPLLPTRAALQTWPRVPLLIHSLVPQARGGTRLCRARPPMAPMIAASSCTPGGHRSRLLRRARVHPPARAQRRRGRRFPFGVDRSTCSALGWRSLLPGTTEPVRADAAQHGHPSRSRWHGSCAARPRSTC